MPTRTERKARQLADQIAEIERGKVPVLTPARAAFLAHAEGRGKLVEHAGWPDFLVEDHQTRSVMGIIVRANDSALLPAHERTATMLEHAAVHVYVWNPKRPDTLTPWRRYVLDRETPRSAPAPKRRRRYV